MISPRPAGSVDAPLSGGDLRVVPSRHPFRWFFAVLLALFVAMVARALVTSPNIHWDVVRRYQFAPIIVHGVLVTLELTVICQALGVALGIVLAVMQVSENPVLEWFSWFYIWFFRGTPVLVQLIFWYNLALLFPVLHLGLPFTPFGIDLQTNHVINGFTAAVLGLGLNEAAYMAEIVRAGILSVERGQREAAVSLGMTSGQAMRRIVLPQAMRVIVPPTGNQLINLLKATSLVAFIAGGDLLSVAENIFSTNFQVIPLLIVASLWYLAITSVATVLQHMLEKRVGQGFGTSGKARGLGFRFRRSPTLSGT